MVKEEKRSAAPVVVIVVVVSVVLLPVLYFLSWGPVLLYYKFHVGGFTSWYFTFYGPLNWFCDVCPPFREFSVWYLSFYGYPWPERPSRRGTHRAAAPGCRSRVNVLWSSPSASSAASVAGDSGLQRRGVSDQSNVVNLVQVHVAAETRGNPALLCGEN